MGLELKFKQIKGDPKRPFGIAGFYVPNISDLNKNFLAIGGDPSKINVSDYRLELYEFSDYLKEIIMKCKYRTHLFSLSSFIGAGVDEFSSYFPGDLFKATNGVKINSYLIKRRLCNLISEEIKKYGISYMNKHKFDLGPIPEKFDMKDVFERIDSGRFD